MTRIRFSFLHLSYKRPKTSLFRINSNLILGKQKFLYFSGHYTKLLTGDIYMTESFVLFNAIRIWYRNFRNINRSRWEVLFSFLSLFFFIRIPSPESITAISMAVVAANASVGSMAYTFSKE